MGNDPKDDSDSKKTEAKPSNLGRYKVTGLDGLSVGRRHYAIGSIVELDNADATKLKAVGGVEDAPAE